MLMSVLTGDIIGSSKLKAGELAEVLTKLQQTYQAFEPRVHGAVSLFETYRGDSFQAVVQKPVEALKMILHLKTVIKKLDFGHAKNSKAIKSPLDFRIALGIGCVDNLPQSMSKVGGEAFVFSGRTLDKMKGKRQKTALQCAQESINQEFEVHFKFLDMLTDKWSIASAEVVYFLLQDWKETDIATELNISQAAVNSRKKASGWEVIALLLHRYETLMNQSFRENTNT